MGRKKGGIPGLSFSAKRAFGVTKAKRRFAKATGIPTTRSGRRNKAVRVLSGGGCIFPMLIVILVLVIFCFVI